MWIVLFLSFIQRVLCNNIQCVDVGACQNNQLICTSNEDCSILCDGENSCREVDILCPSGNNHCIINVQGQRALYRAHINSSMMEGGNLVITANGSNAMYGTNIDCPRNGHCNITGASNANSVFSSATIRADPLTQLLYISVEESYSLRYANVLCPNPTGTQKNCIINAFGDGSGMIEALKIISVYGSSNVLLQCSSTNCWYDEYPTLSCTPYFTSQCQMKAMSGNVYECVDDTALCYGNNSAALGYERIDDFILCFGTYACQNQQRICNEKDCYIYCGGLYGCIGASFECPKEYDCIVTANGKDSMYSSGTVNAESSNGNLSINGYGQAALDRLTVRCPQNSKCSITVSGGGYRMMSDLKIYGFQYASDLDVRCEYGTSVDYDCYYSGGKPKMYCDLDQIFCELNLITGFDGFECISNTSLCYGTRSPTATPTTSSPTNPTNYPTNYPTKTPTLTPTNYPTKTPTLTPTNYPTKTPTLTPTNYPTKTPTLTPTNYPTKNPTLTPTNYATKNPTLTPTKNPTLISTKNPTLTPTNYPTKNPTLTPTKNPTLTPTNYPTKNPTLTPTKNPTLTSTKNPTLTPTNYPTKNPTKTPNSVMTNTCSSTVPLSLFFAVFVVLCCS